MTDQTDHTLPMPQSVMIWFSDPEISHAGTWATTRYPDNAQRYVAAGAVEQFLKDGETVEQRMHRFHHEVLGLLKYLEEVKRDAETARDDVLEVAAQMAESMHMPPPPGIYGHRASAHWAGQRIGGAIRAMKGGA